MSLHVQRCPAANHAVQPARLVRIGVLSLALALALAVPALVVARRGRRMALPNTSSIAVGVVSQSPAVISNMSRAANHHLLVTANAVKLALGTTAGLGYQHLYNATRADLRRRARPQPPPAHSA